MGLSIGYGSSTELIVVGLVWCALFIGTPTDIHVRFSTICGAAPSLDFTNYYSHYLF